MTLAPLKTSPGRLGLLFAAFVVALSALLSVAIRDAHRAAADADQRLAEVMAEVVAQRSADAGVVKWPEAIDALAPLLAEQGVRITAVDPVSQRLLHTAGATITAAERRDRGAIGSARLLEPVPWLVVNVELASRHAEYASLHRRTTLTALFAVAVILVIAWLVGSRQLVRAHEVARTADELAGGNLAELPSVWARGEFEPIAAALERLVRQIGPRLSHLQNLSAEQQAILESMGSGLVAIDPDQRILSLNQAAATLLAIDAARVRGRLVQEVTRQPGLNQFVAEAISAAGAIDGEFQIEREGRGRLLLQARSEPLRDPGGRPAGLLVVLTDITTLRRLETLRADFAANVSHELRTPITNIKGYVETLLQVGVDDPEQASRFLEIIQRNAHRLATIIEDLLALTRLEQPGVRETLERTTVEAQRIAESVVTHLLPTAEAKSIELVNEVPELLEIHVMPTLVEQALANLVANAITYSPAETVVRITGRRLPDGGAELAVIDLGPGIPARHLSRIFERFYRVDKARSREHGGTGLGLAIVKHIALVHGGTVEVESKVGAGSTFRLRLGGASSDHPRGEPSSR